MFIAHMKTVISNDLCQLIGVAVRVIHTCFFHPKCIVQLYFYLMLGDWVRCAIMQWTLHARVPEITSLEA